MTRLEAAEEILSDLREAIGKNAVVSLSYNDDGMKGFISFHENDRLSGEVDPIHIKFEDQDFDDPESLIKDVKGFVPNHINEQLE